MAPVYADHPFQLIPTPIHQAGKDAKTDVFDSAASDMALVHNMMIRGLNAMYLQAPHVKASEGKAFCTFASKWCDLLHVHHTGEETMFFPEIEKLTGEKGIMDRNVEQHHEFEGGVKTFTDYVRGVVAGTEKFDGQKIVELIDSFGSVLVQHLSDEIPTIVGLRKHAEKLGNIKERFDKEGEENMKLLGLGGLAACFAMLDIHFEDDLWLGFPPAPGFVIFLVRNVVWWFSASALKFGACDRKGNMKPLYAVPEPAKSM